MRTLFNIISLATLFLLIGFQQKSAASPALQFYIVSEEKIDGGKFVDTSDFPKLGYIYAMPDLVITKLESVQVSTNTVFEKDENGKLIVKPSILILMSSDDAKKFSALTKKAVGKQVLLELDDAPLIAPRVMQPIETPSLQLSMGGHTDEKKIENELKQLVH